MRVILRVCASTIARASRYGRQELPARARNPYGRFFHRELLIIRIDPND
jgi:hypothetical protein